MLSTRVYKTPERKRTNQRAYRSRWKNDPKWVRAQRKYFKQYRKKHKARLTKASRDYQRKHALRIQLRRKGLTLEEYERVVAKQGETCAICGGPPGGRWKKYNIDHCHKTGRMRGLLCKACNHAIGLFRDNPRLLKRAIAYLRRYRRSLK